jgi:hypothetical protein
LSSFKPGAPDGSSTSISSILLLSNIDWLPALFAAIMVKVKEVIKNIIAIIQVNLFRAVVADLFAIKLLSPPTPSPPPSER